jgi:hypothetical protein
MVDPVGAALNLPGCFIACVQCFELIQYGKSFEDDHENLVLRLDFIGLSLARWGKAIGILDEGSSIVSHRSSGKCAEYISTILKRFEEAESKLNDAQIDKSPMKEEVRSKNLRKKMQRFRYNYVTKYENVSKRAKWAMYNKTVLEELVSHLREDVQDLINLFPVTQRPLQKKEVQELGIESLMLMKKIATDEDEIMEDIIVKEMDSRERDANTFEEIDYEGHTDMKFRAGDTVARDATPTERGNRYKGIKLRGAGTVDLGTYWL